MQTQSNANDKAVVSSDPPQLLQKSTFGDVLDATKKDVFVVLRNRLGKALVDDYSFSRAKDGKAEPLLSVQQARLVKRLLEKHREYSVDSARPKLSPGWVLLHWVQRKLTRVGDEQG